MRRPALPPWLLPWLLRAGDVAAWSLSCVDIVFDNTRSRYITALLFFWWLLYSTEKVSQAVESTNFGHTVTVTRGNATVEELSDASVQLLANSAQTFVTILLYVALVPLANLFLLWTSPSVSPRLVWPLALLGSFLLALLNWGDLEETVAAGSTSLVVIFQNGIAIFFTLLSMRYTCLRMPSFAATRLETAYAAVRGKFDRRLLFKAPSGLLLLFGLGVRDASLSKRGVLRRQLDRLGLGGNRDRGRSVMPPDAPTITDVVADADRRELTVSWASDADQPRHFTIVCSGRMCPGVRRTVAASDALRDDHSYQATVPGVVSGRVYRVGVAVKDAAGLSELSSTVEAEVPLLCGLCAAEPPVLESVDDFTAHLRSEHAQTDADLLRVMHSGVQASPAAITRVRDTSTAEAPLDGDVSVVKAARAVLLPRAYGANRYTESVFFPTKLHIGTGFTCLILAATLQYVGETADAVRAGVAGLKEFSLGVSEEAGANIDPAMGYIDTLESLYGCVEAGFAVSRSLDSAVDVSALADGTVSTDCEAALTRCDCQSSFYFMGAVGFNARTIDGGGYTADPASDTLVANLNLDLGTVDDAFFAPDADCLALLSQYACADVATAMALSASIYDPGTAGNVDFDALRDAVNGYLGAAAYFFGVLALMVETMEQPVYNGVVVGMVLSCMAIAYSNYATYKAYKTHVLRLRAGEYSYGLPRKTFGAQWSAQFIGCFCFFTATSFILTFALIFFVVMVLTNALVWDYLESSIGYIATYLLCSFLGKAFFVKVLLGRVLSDGVHIRHPRAFRVLVAVMEVVLFPYSTIAVTQRVVLSVVMGLVSISRMDFVQVPPALAAKDVGYKAWVSQILLAEQQSNSIRLVFLDLLRAAAADARRPGAATPGQRRVRNRLWLWIYLRQYPQLRASRGHVLAAVVRAPRCRFRMSAVKERLGNVRSWKNVEMISTGNPLAAVFGKLSSVRDVSSSAEVVEDERDVL